MRWRRRRSVRALVLAAVAVGCIRGHRAIGLGRCEARDAGAPRLPRGRHRAGGEAHGGLARRRRGYGARCVRAGNGGCDGLGTGASRRRRHAGGARDAGAAPWHRCPGEQAAVPLRGADLALRPRGHPRAHPAHRLAHRSRARSATRTATGASSRCAGRGRGRERLDGRRGLGLRLSQVLDVGGFVKAQLFGEQPS